LLDCPADIPSLRLPLEYFYWQHLDNQDAFFYKTLLLKISDVPTGRNGVIRFHQSSLSVRFPEIVLTMNRRTFVKIAGMGSISFAFGCSPPQKNLFSQVQAPQDMLTGKATWYASTCRECPAGCGILAKNREGRVVKIEGNPLHPINTGKICMRGQAALQGIYNPDRITKPLLKTKDGWRTISYSKAQAILKDKTDAAAQRGSDRVRVLTECVGDSLMNLLRLSLKNWNSQGPLVFEPYAYETLKIANKEVFGIDGLMSYRMEQAGFLLSFGADFLETWLSPVEYAWKLKSMHTLKNGSKALFFQVSPYQSMTAANADEWLACNPGSEATVALGLVKQALDIGKGKKLRSSFRNAIYRATAAYTQEKVLQDSGIPLPKYEKLMMQLMGAPKPLVLGTGTGPSDPNGLQTNLGANLLNLLLDPKLRLIDFENRHRVEIAAGRSEIRDFFQSLKTGHTDVLLLNNVNPVFGLPSSDGIKETLESSHAFRVSFSSFMDETSLLADLILPVRLPLESWDEYGGRQTMASTLQPAMGKLTPAPNLGDVFLEAGFEKKKPAINYKAYLYSRLQFDYHLADEKQWVQTLQKGGVFEPRAAKISLKKIRPQVPVALLSKTVAPIRSDLSLIATPSIRFFDGRGANKPWLCEIPDPLSMVAWQTPLLVHPETLNRYKLVPEDIAKVETRWGRLEAPVYAANWVRPGVLIMGIGQGHTSYGRYARNQGANPFHLLAPLLTPESYDPSFSVAPVSMAATGRTLPLAHTDGSRIQHGRKVALSIKLTELQNPKPHEKPHGLGMWEFPFTLPLPEGYSPQRDFYPPHDHDQYRWAMVVDLDRCIGCSACACACYAENNLGVVGAKHMLEGREMAWLQVQRYLDPKYGIKVNFLPMLCQHCDNAPCESVCPVFAPHHNKEGINNQIYNRCIGTRFCSQNCPYKVRRFNWFDWKWPAPLNLQLNPDVTVRSKGVMEKCSFCIQRIKAAHNNAKNENRSIRDGEVIPACAQTCPTNALIFGNLMDPDSRVRKLVEDPRAYQVMGYLNTKPAVIYLKKVLQEV
jgi:anaerobic selenocysteine-containing dehydrogenase/Fe-S-cluster-containing dehydrogenase component